MADRDLEGGAKPRNRSYVRTEAHRAAVAEKNRLIKRKYPAGYDTKSRLYRIWRAMLFRCYQPTHEAYERYHGRGIGVCDEWRNDYIAFMEWALSNGYKSTLTLDREDNDRGYEPGNCRWATSRAQNLNRRDNLAPLTIFGETRLVLEWASDPRCAVGNAAFRHRLARGWAPEVALTTPLERTVVHAPITAFGETKRPDEWAADPRCRVSLAAIYTRRRLGWAGEDIVSRPKREMAMPGADSCAKGHRLTPDNTYTNPQGTKRCRECLRERDRRRRRGRK